VFDRTVIEGRPGTDSQTMNLAPSQGGWAEFTLAEEGSYPFVTHVARHYAAGQTMPFEVTG
jgi:nitrite reductase (NO-forming)